MHSVAASTQEDAEVMNGTMSNANEKSPRPVTPADSRRPQTGSSMAGNPGSPQQVSPEAPRGRDKDPRNDGTVSQAYNKIGAWCPDCSAKCKACHLGGSSKNQDSQDKGVAKGKEDAKSKEDADGKGDAKGKADAKGKGDAESKGSPKDKANSPETDEKSPKK